MRVASRHASVGVVRRRDRAAARRGDHDHDRAERTQPVRPLCRDARAGRGRSRQSSAGGRDGAAPHCRPRAGPAPADARGGTRPDRRARAIRNQRSRWGSCSTSGVITLNFRLVQMPSWVSDYVLLHELMHTCQQNHSRRYWRLVEQVCPHFRAAETWLRVEGKALLMVLRGERCVLRRWRAGYRVPRLPRQQHQRVALLCATAFLIPTRARMRGRFSPAPPAREATTPSWPSTSTGKQWAVSA